MTENETTLIYSSFALAILTCLSAFILTLQRTHYHTSQQTEDTLPLHFDDKRDLSFSMPDHTKRQRRLTLDAAVITIAITFQLYATVSESSNWYLPASVFAQFIMWLYALVLVVVSHNYRLPNEWGWILNSHLVCLFAAAWCVSLFGFFKMFISMPDLKSWTYLFPDLLIFTLNTDLLYLTVTVPQGPPFFDENGRHVTTIYTSSIASYLYFSWLTPLVNLAYKKQKLADEDLPALPDICRSYNFFYLFRSTKANGLVKRIYLTNKKDMHAQLVVSTLVAVLFYAPPFFINRFLNLLQTIHSDKYDGEAIREAFVTLIYLAVSVFTLGVLLVRLWHYSISTIYIRVRSMLSIGIYHKTLHCRDLAVASNTTEDSFKSSIGTIVNLMSTDTGRISMFLLQWWMFISAPIELVVGFYFLYTLLGKSCLLGIVVMIVVLPLNHFNARMFTRTQDKLMKMRDQRISLMNEALQGIRQIKFFSWEKNWEKRIMEARKDELKQLAVSYVSQVLFSIIWQASPIIVTLVSFWSFTKLEGHQLTAPVAFTSIAVFEELRFALNILPEMFSQFLQARVSLKRIEKYFEEGEINQPEESTTPTSPLDIGFKNATVGWNFQPYKDTDDNLNDGASNFVLKDLNVQFPLNKLSLICGVTGSGKTLMMLSLLNEAFIISGEVHCPRQAVAETLSDTLITSSIEANDWILPYAVSYVAQNAWLQNASIRDNILFGLPFLEARYQETLYACALNTDLEIFEDGDLTEIGEKGITLSGGQKARVSLARAVYSRAQIVLLDDVLSAVDAHTAKHLYEKCLLGPLMKDRTRILITHHVGLCLNGSDYIVHVEGGSADIVGTPNELRQSGQLGLIFEESNHQAEEEAFEETKPHLQEEERTKKPRELVEEETRATGSVNASLYKLYINAVGNPFFWATFLLLVFTARAFHIGESWWLKEWSRTYSNTTTDEEVQPAGLQLQLLAASSNNDSLNYYLGVYCAINMATIVTSAAQHAFLYWGALGANKLLHEKLLHRVFRAPLRFFDTTPIGRILNRFSKDFESVDSQVPSDIIGFTVQCVSGVFTVFAVSGVLPIFMVPLTLVVIANVRISMMLVVTARELKRMVSTTRSPLLSHYTETIIGVTTIRAFGATRQFLRQMVDYMDIHNRPDYYLRSVSRWINIRLTLSGAILNFVTGSIILLNVGTIDVSLAGFCMSFVSFVTMEIYNVVKKYRDLEVSFNSIERVVELMEIKQEAPGTNDFKVSVEWPSKGEVKVSNLEIKYADDLALVLQDVSFTTAAQEKVGIVGRTGSGKSTLALSFFRFLEASKGSIEIDGIDIRSLGLEYLRSNLTIIPQDPVLFSGTLRSNLDPFNTFMDKDIFLALRRVHLIQNENDESSVSVVGSDSDATTEINTNVFLDLNTPVTEGGKNFSQGQRQLLCLARAILKRSRVVFMDEATASVDFKTDRAIQKTLLQEFSDSTIFCIAHRLHSVIEYDRILVMNQGKVLEFDSPWNLIQDEKSTFYNMCRKSGEFDILYSLAKSKFDRNQ